MADRGAAFCSIKSVVYEKFPYVKFLNSTFYETFTISIDVVSGMCFVIDAVPHVSSLQYQLGISLFRAHGWTQHFYRGTLKPAGGKERLGF